MSRNGVEKWSPKYGAVVRRAREVALLTQEELAAKVRKHRKIGQLRYRTGRTQICRLEQGVAGCSRNLRIILCVLLGIKDATLLGVVVSE